MLTQLRYFLAVVKYHNFTEAAEACHISQSAISQQIKALEQELGVPLLTRQGRSFAMTPAGELLYQRGLQLLADYERLCHDVKRLGTESESSLHIGYLRDYTGPELQRAVATFMKPIVRLKFTLPAARTKKSMKCYGIIRFKWHLVISDGYFRKII